MGVAIASGSVSQPMTGRVSRRSSGWGEINGDEGNQEKEDKEERPAGLKEEDSFDAMPEGTTETTTTATTKN
jgi:hypothetical protein